MGKSADYPNYPARDREPMSPERIMRAAELLREGHACLTKATGYWPARTEPDREARAAHLSEMLALADELEEMAKRQPQGNQGK